MNICSLVVEQLFVSINVINVISLFILIYMAFLMRDSKWQWVWYILFGILLVVATFGSEVSDGCEVSGVVWRLEFIPGHVGVDWQTYALLVKFIWRFVYDVMVYER